MKKLFTIIAILVLLLPSCGKINDEIDALGNRIDMLEQETIPTIDEQIVAINTTLGNLDAMDKELKGYINNLTSTASSLQEQINTTNTKIGEVKAELEGDISTAKSEVLAELESLETELKNELSQINATIETLNAKDAELDQKIAELRTYVDSELSKTTDWANATFATLEQYNTLVSEIATIKEQIKAINQSITDLETRLTTKINEDIANAVSTLNADIQQKVSEITDAYTNAVKTAKEEITSAYTTAIQTAITTLDNSLKTWVGEQLSNYYTIAQVDALISSLSAEFEGKLSTQKIYLESLITSLSQTLTSKITDNSNLITALRNDLTTLDGEVAKNAEAIANNAEKISENASAIIENSKAIVANGENIEANKGSIEANTKLIAENKLLIEEVETKIDNTSNGANATAIANNAKLIADNAKAIADNAELIAQNSVAINNNAVAIAQNTADIAQLQQDLTTTKTEITEAYKSAISTAITTLNGELRGEIATQVSALSTRIDNEVSSINNTIATLANRVTTIENEVNSIKQQIAKILSDIADMKEDIANLLARIQSVSYVPKYSDGNATMDYGTKTAEFDFLISPKSAVAELAKVWNSALSVKAVYTQTRAVEFTNLPITEFVADNSNGVISVRVSGTNLNDEFYTDQQGAKAMLQISDGNSSLTSEYISMLPNYNIRFEDEYVKAICVANWDTNGDNELSYEEAANVTTIGGKFSSFIMDEESELKIIGNHSVLSFNELQYFTGITKLTGKAFSYDINLTNVVLPENLTEIADGGCTVPYHVYYGTFARTNINHIDIPNSVTKIGSYAFYNCSNLKYISVGNSVASIGSNAFSNCSNLKSISIGNSVNSIGSEAFSNCTGELGINNKKLIETNYSSSTYPMYKSDGWLYGSKFSKVVIGKDVVSIGDYTFYECSSLTSVSIPNSVISIGSYCFNKCSALTNIKLSEGIYSIGEYAFSECRNLTDIVIPDGIASIGTYCFDRCSNLTTVTIGKDIATIGRYAFCQCSKLKNIYCKALVPPVAYNTMFASCSSLSLIYVPKESVADYRAATGWSQYASKIVGYDFE